MHGPHPGTANLPLLLLESTELLALPDEGLRGLDPCDGLMDVGVQIALLVGQTLVGPPLEALEDQHIEHQQGHENQGPEGQPPVDDEHDHQGQQEGEDVRDYVD